MNHVKSVVIVALVLISAQFAYAGGDVTVFSMEADGGIGYFAPPTVSYKYSTTNSNYDINTDESSFWTAGLKAGNTLNGLGWSEDSLFGDAPIVELAYRYDDYDETDNNISRPGAAGQAAGYGATGNWGAGTWDYDQEIRTNAFRLGLWGSNPKDGGFVPYVGIGYQRYNQDWKLHRNNVSVFTSKLNGDYYGLMIGGAYRTAHCSGWQFTATPMVFVNYVRSDLNFQQDPDAAIGGFDTVDDSMSTSFMSVGAGLDLSVKKYFGDTFYLGLTGGAVYNSRTPYGRPPTTTAGRAQIASDSSYAVRGTLDIGFEF